jgi:hypothetical protein
MARTAFLVTSALAVAALGFQMSTAHGKHSWSNYHWESTSHPVNFVLVHNLNEDWDLLPKDVTSTFLEQASIDWSNWAGRDHQIIDTSVFKDETRTTHNPGACEIDDNYNEPADHDIEVCSDFYGSNGWLGLAQIWVIDGHIIKAVTKLNDSYFNAGTYDTPEWRDLVMCQEVGHAFGLGHQDESFFNPDKVDADGVQTCMDYTNRPAGNGQPNSHDYDQLELIYNHNDESPDTVEDTGPGYGKGGKPKQGSVPGKLVVVSGFEFATYVRNDPSEWGTAVAFTDKGQPHVFVKDLDNGVTVITHVTWTEDARAGAHFPHQP